MSRTSWCGAVSHGLCPVGYTAKRAPSCRANRSCSSRGQRSCSPTATSFGTGEAASSARRSGVSHHEPDDVVDALATREGEPLAHECEPAWRDPVEVVADAPEHERRPLARRRESADRPDALDAPERLPRLGRCAQQREARESVGALEQGELGERASEAVAEHVRAGRAVVEHGEEVVEEQPLVVPRAWRVEVPRAGGPRLVLPGEVVGLDPVARPPRTAASSARSPPSSRSRRARARRAGRRPDRARPGPAPRSGRRSSCARCRVGTRASRGRGSPRRAGAPCPRHPSPTRRRATSRDDGTNRAPLRMRPRPHDTGARRPPARARAGAGDRRADAGTRVAHSEHRRTVQPAHVGLPHGNRRADP